MRVRLNKDLMVGEFTSQHLKISDGKIAKTKNVKVVIPPRVGSIFVSFKKLRSKVHPNISKLWLTERVILILKNGMVNVINQQLLDEIPGEEKTIFNYRDSTLDNKQVVQYPTKFIRIAWYGNTYVKSQSWIPY